MDGPIFDDAVHLETMSVTVRHPDEWNILGCFIFGKQVQELAARSIGKAASLREQVVSKNDPTSHNSKTTDKLQLDSGRKVIVS